VDQFRHFDDEANNMISSLHLDADDEPRRSMGATSRANSVRFDETANTNHFSHTSRASGDFMLRTSSALSGLQLGERSMSYKSEGRASSQHSLRSVASGRANSLNMDLAYGEAMRSPLDTPGFAPGLALLGAVPAIIRCWMNTNFKHDALLYAAVCSGSFKSFLDSRLIHKLGFDSVIRTDDNGIRTVELPIFFPEAVPLTSSSRSSSPAPHLPSLTAEFRVVDHASDEGEGQAIQILIGSDILRAHNADILFSSNSMTIYDGDRNKLSIPLARPENQATYNTLHTTSGLAPSSSSVSKQQEEAPTVQPFLNGLGQDSSSDLQISSNGPHSAKYRPPAVLAVGGGSANDAHRPSSIPTTSIDSENTTRPPSRQSIVSRPSLGNLSASRTDTSGDVESSSSLGLTNTSLQPSTSTARSGGSSPALWANSWRRGEPSGGVSPAIQPSSQPPSTGLPSSNSNSSNALDWGAIANNRLRDSTNTFPSTRREGGLSGIKVLKPKTALSSTSTRAVSTSSAAPSPVIGATTNVGPEAKITPSSVSNSRFFEEGRQRIDPPKKENALGLGLLPSASAGTAPSTAAAAAAAGSTTPKTKTNPIGGASAFSWLNPGGGGAAGGAGSTGGLK
jgi:hypothetical protein